MSKEVLKKLLGNLYTDQIGEAIGTNELAVVNDGSYIPRAKYTEEVKDLKSQLKARDEQLEQLKSKATGSDALQKEVERLQAENKETTTQYETKVQQLQLDHALERALSSNKAKNPKAVRALLNLENIKLDGEKLLGLDDQIKTLKESDAYLFGEGGTVGNSSNPAGSTSNEGAAAASMNSFIRGAIGR